MSSGRPADHTGHAPSPGPSAGDERLRGSVVVRSVRYGIGAVMVLGGIIVLILNPGGFGVDGFAMAVGGGLSVLMINFLFRLGVSGDLEREAEEQARRFFDEHGYWPDEAPGEG
jgi:hypothetical protein